MIAIMMLSIEAMFCMMFASKLTGGFAILFWIMTIYNIIGIYIQCKAYSLFQSKFE